MSEKINEANRATAFAFDSLRLENMPLNANETKTVHEAAKHPEKIDEIVRQVLDDNRKQW